MPRHSEGALEELPDQRRRCGPHTPRVRPGAKPRGYESRDLSAVAKDHGGRANRVSWVKAAEAGGHKLITANRHEPDTADLRVGVGGPSERRADESLAQ